MADHQPLIIINLNKDANLQKKDNKRALYPETALIKRSDIDKYDRILSDALNENISNLAP